MARQARGASFLRLKLSRTQLEAELANLPPCLVGMEACVGIYHLSRRLKTLGHDQAKCREICQGFPQGQQERFRDAGAASRSGSAPDHALCCHQDCYRQLDLQAMHAECALAYWSAERTATIALEIRAFARSWCRALTQSLHQLRAALCRASLLPPYPCCRRACRIIVDLVLLTGVASMKAHRHCLTLRRSRPWPIRMHRLRATDSGATRGIGPIISSATVAAIGTGVTCSQGRDFGACSSA